MANIMQAEHRKAKAAQIKKNKASRHAARSDRLAKMDPQALEREITQLKQQPSSTPNDRRKLQILERQLQSVIAAKKRLGFKQKDIDVTKSVFYDPVLNPQGTPPNGMDQVFIYDLDSEYSTDDDVKSIPWPKFKPGSLGAAPAKVTYESQPVLRDMDKEVSSLVPAAVLKKRKLQGN